MSERHVDPRLPICADSRAAARPCRQPTATLADIGAAASIPMCAIAASDDRGASQPARSAAPRDRAQCAALAEWEGEGGRVAAA